MRRSLRHPAAVLLLAAGVLSAGCGRDGAAAPGLGLAGGTASLDELLATVESALAERDTQRLFDLMVTEGEYRAIVYPELPAAHPPIGASFESIWVTHYPDAYQGLMRVLRDYGGRDVRILDVRFERPDQDFGSFILHETSRVDIVVDGAREDDRRLFGSVIHAGGRWKVLSYPDEG
jgi:hypothetical protein